MDTNHREPKRSTPGDSVAAERSRGGRLDRKSTEILRRTLLDQKRSLLRRQREALDEEEQLLEHRTG